MRLFCLQIMCLLLLTSIKVQAQIEKVFVENYYLSDSIDATDTTGGVLEMGSKTYRIYIDLKPGTKIKKIYGDAFHPIIIKSTENFYNHATDGQTFGKDFSKNRLGDLQAQIDTFDRKTLRFTPDELYNSDNDIKVLKLNFNTDLAGIGTQSIGSISLTGSNKIVSSGTTSTIVSYSLPNFESIFANIQIFNTITREINYLEVLLDYDGTNTYISEYYFDSGSESSSQKYVGILTATANLVPGMVMGKDAATATIPTPTKIGHIP